MPKPPDDRPKQQAAAGSETEPKIFVVVNGHKFPRPSLETMFVQAHEGKPENDCNCHPVVGAYCSCNKVCTCVPVCACVGHVSCSCDSHTTTTVGCRCAPVH
jgi:hypothetical protein